MSKYNSVSERINSYILVNDIQAMKWENKHVNGCICKYQVSKKATKSKQLNINNQLNIDKNQFQPWHTMRFKPDRKIDGAIKKKRNNIVLKQIWVFVELSKDLAMQMQNKTV